MVVSSSNPQLFGDKISEEVATLKGSPGWALNLDWDPKREWRQRHPEDDHGCKPRTGHREEPGLKFPSWNFSLQNVKQHLADIPGRVPARDMGANPSSLDFGVWALFPGWQQSCWGGYQVPLSSPTLLG